MSIRHGGDRPGYIRLHPKHGLNPTMSVCFWCSEPTGEVVLLGASYKDEAPRNLVLNYDPCKSCTEKMALGIALMEHNGKEPTSRWVVIIEDAFTRIFTGDIVTATLKSRKAYVEPQVFKLFTETQAEEQI